MKLFSKFALWSATAAAAAMLFAGCSSPSSKIVGQWYLSQDSEDSYNPDHADLFISFHADGTGARGSDVDNKHEEFFKWKIDDNGQLTMTELNEYGDEDNRKVVDFTISKISSSLMTLTFDKTEDGIFTKMREKTANPELTGKWYMSKDSNNGTYTAETSEYVMTFYDDGTASQSFAPNVKNSSFFVWYIEDGELVEAKYDGALERGTKIELTADDTMLYYIIYSNHDPITLTRMK